MLDAARQLHAPVLREIASGVVVGGTELIGCLRKSLCSVSRSRPHVLRGVDRRTFDHHAVQALQALQPREFDIVTQHSFGLVQSLVQRLGEDAFDF